MNEFPLESLDDIKTDISEEETQPENQEENKMSSIKKVFEAANDNVKAATGIFDRCVNMKKKLDEEKKELEDLRKTHEKKCSDEIEKVKKYKDDVYRALKEKKAQLDSEAEDLKQRELELSNNRNRLEMDKKKAYEKIRAKEEQQKENLLQKNKELDQRKKDLDEEKKQIELEKEKADQTAKELEQNLLKFNDVVKQFTSGIDDLVL